MKVEVKSTDSKYVCHLLVDDENVGSLFDAEFNRWVCTIDASVKRPSYLEAFEGCFDACDNTPAGIVYSIGQCVEGVTSMFADGEEVPA